MKHIIFDCDNTLGIPGHPMDDALALIYLLGLPEEADILGITCTFGNGTAKQVYAATKALLADIGRADIPLLHGAEAGENPISEAARFIVQTVNDHPGKISLVAIGSLTNLYGAYLLDNSIFQKVHQIVLMGGYTAPLLYHGGHLEELNFSVNPAAASAVLNQGQRISILTGNNTLVPSYLPREEFDQILRGNGEEGSYIAQICGYRFDDKEKNNGDAASYCWDVVASVYLLHPELFQSRQVNCFVSERTMCSGWLGITEAAPDTCCLNLPEVSDTAIYRQEMYRGWLGFQRREMA